MRLSSALVVAVLTVCGGAPRAQTAAAADVLDNAAAYVRQFVKTFANVVAEERYTQRSQGVPHTVGSGFDAHFVEGVPTREVELLSDFLMVRADERSDYVAFRDVASVNGKPVRDRVSRLANLLIHPSPETVEQARRLSAEGARYDLTGRDSMVNNPLVALGLLQDRYRPRFRFTVRDVDKSVGPDVRIIQFREEARPTVLRQDARDAPSSGRIWVEGITGRIVKTELVVSANRVTTAFRFDDRFQINVPVTMNDLLQYRDGAVFGTATYGRFRRFDVKTDEELERLIR